jgi:levanase/fructan beta-fructosidase
MIPMGCFITIVIITFYQYYPDSNIMGTYALGHAISTDLISWTETYRTIPRKKGYIFRKCCRCEQYFRFGSLNNPMVAMFTYHDMKRKKAGETNYQSGYCLFNR